MMFRFVTHEHGDACSEASMNAPAAFKACYSDWRLIKGRKVIQVVLEIPLEAADEAYAALNGMPNPASEVWVGVARLKNESEVVPTERRTDNQYPAANNPRRTSETPPASANKPARAPRSWHEMTPAQQAGVLCKDIRFQRFLDIDMAITIKSEQDAIDAVRDFCGIQSRKQLNDGGRPAELWRALVSDYRAWDHEPEFVG